MWEIKAVLITIARLYTENAILTSLYRIRAGAASGGGGSAHPN